MLSGVRAGAKREERGDKRRAEAREPGAQRDERNEPEHEQHEAVRDEDAIDAESRDEDEAGQQASGNASKRRPEEDFARDLANPLLGTVHAQQLDGEGRQHAKKERRKQEQERRRDQRAYFDRERAAE